MRTGSPDWWFRNRQTGRITVGQFPNWPLFAIVIGWVVRSVAAEGSTAHTVTGWAVTVLWLYWGGDEIVRGVNPWRRALGSAVVAITIIGLLT